jgi:hypothetical protein
MPREPHLEALPFRDWRIAAVAFGWTAIGIVFAVVAAASP